MQDTQEQEQLEHQLAMRAVNKLLDRVERLLDDVPDMEEMK